MMPVVQVICLELNEDLRERERLERERKKKRNDGS
jgi:hypothetical protein